MSLIDDDVKLARLIVLGKIVKYKCNLTLIECKFDYKKLNFVAVEPRTNHITTIITHNLRWV